MTHGGNPVVAHPAVVWIRAMSKLRMTAAAIALAFGATVVLPSCAGVYVDSSGKTCVIVLAIPICN